MRMCETTPRAPRHKLPSNPSLHREEGIPAAITMATPPAIVLYGSQSGTAESVARRVHADAAKHGVAASIQPMNDFKKVSRAVHLQRATRERNFAITVVAMHVDPAYCCHVGEHGEGAFAHFCVCDDGRWRDTRQRGDKNTPQKN